MRPWLAGLALAGYLPVAGVKNNDSILLVRTEDANVR